MFLSLFIFCLCYLYPIHESFTPVHLGDETVTLQIFERGHGKTFVHLHQNEITARRAAFMVVRAEGGLVLTLRHHGGRNIVFHDHGERYEFDPNRIFTEAGIKKTLLQGGNYSQRAHQLVEKLADEIKAALPAGKIIAVHNNQSYSMRDYYEGQSLAADASALHVAREQAYRNFYLVTQAIDFDRLKQLKMNSILQAEQPTDDGSLSVYLGARQYVNVEAGYDALSMQLKMLHHA